MTAPVFATVEDLEARWRPLSEDEQARADVLLADASAYIASMMSAAGASYTDPDDLLESALRSVTCNVVKRAMDSPGGYTGLTQYTQGAIGYSESMSYANPNGDMYLTKAEKRLLGIGTGTFGTVRPAVHAPDGRPIHGW